MQNLFFMIRMEEKRYTLHKTERLSSKKLIERLFGGGNKSFPAFPIRVVYMYQEPEETLSDVSILISVPKKRFKHAVDRNRVKRQIREAYRHNKHILHHALENQSYGLALAFIWLDKELHSSEEVTYRIKSLLERITEKIKGGSIN